MEVQQLLEAFNKAGKKVHLIGDLNAGVIAALDMEGRLFSIMDGEVLNRVNLDAVYGESTREKYINPGGDGLWPAPEGTTKGYQYTTTHGWSVSPSLRAARYRVSQVNENSATITSEVDLINNQGIGIPTLFKRQITVTPGKKSFNVNAVESITYIGKKTYTCPDILLAPWTLSQFDCGPTCEVRFPCRERDSIWDLYEQKSEVTRRWEYGVCHVPTDGSSRFQLGLDKKVPWIEFHDPSRGLIVRRKADSLLNGHTYIDISDAPPDIAPSEKGVCYSVYSDPTNFMEIEAVGGCIEIVLPNTELLLSVNTTFFKS